MGNCKKNVSFIVNKKNYHLTDEGEFILKLSGEGEFYCFIVIS